MGKSQALIRTIGLALILAIGAIAAPMAFAAAPVNLGAATSFSVLAGSAISNTGSSVIAGDIGSYPTTVIGGFPPGLVNGTNHGGDGSTQQAKTDLTAAYLDVASRTPVTTIPTALGSTTLTAGTYTAASGTFGLTGPLTLNGQGDPTSLFIFQMPTTLITAAGSSVVLIGGASACNIYWQVGSSATLGASTTFVGNILALTSITLVTGATVNGRLLARNGAVTLDTNVITMPTCSATASPTPTPTGGPERTPAPTATPTPTATPIAVFTPPGAVAPLATATPRPTAAPTAAPITSLPSTSTLDRSGPLALGGLFLAAIGALLILRSRRFAPTVR